ncbi:GNAT family N-acetyltransferase [uncultured Cohaesibacter sp.]|uniref:GNAT family N-acetyltransferase n=1 Tax=uncultured Cohaesibacter sp. TaxID=1002546 RepID=UPI00292EA091|nr:GNAT family N-acetyltransferase [uncultured Cohaesibacter sp.]
MILKFRLAKPEQLSEIRSLFLKSMGYIANRMGFEQPSEAFSNMGDYQKDRNLYVLQEDGGKILAAAAMKEVENGLYIDFLAVRVDHQRTGLGRRMLAELEMLAESRELSHLRLHTPEVMDELIRYYRTHGFAETHRAPPAHGRDQVNRVHFKKTVTLADHAMDPEHEHDR